MPVRPHVAVLIVVVLSALAVPPSVAVAAGPAAKRTLYGRVDARAAMKVRVKGPQILTVELRAVIPAKNPERTKGTMTVVQDQERKSTFAFAIPAPRQRPLRNEDTLITGAVNTRVQIPPGEHTFEISVQTAENYTFVMRLTTAKGLGMWELDEGAPTREGTAKHEAAGPSGASPGTTALGAETSTTGAGDAGDAGSGGAGAAPGASGGGTATATDTTSDGWPAEPAATPAGASKPGEEDWDIAIEPAAGGGDAAAEVSALDVRGSVLAQTTPIVSRSKPRPESGDFALADIRLGFDIKAWSQSVDASAQVKGELAHDVLFGGNEFVMREGFVDYRLGPFDLRVGRQIVTWGTAEFVFVNDTFPKGWQGYLLGRPMEYFKIGVDGARVHLSSDLVNIEVVATPVFTPDDIPSAARFVLFDPVADLPSRVLELPARDFANAELAVRVDTRIFNIDLAAYGHRGRWRTPSLRFDDPMMPTTAIFYYPRLDTAGASASLSILGAVLSLEGAYYDSRDDRRGDNPFCPNSQVRGLAALQASPIADMVLSVQYYVEWMQKFKDYEATWPPSFAPMKQDEYRHAVTAKITQALFSQRLTLSVFGYYGITEKDVLVQPMLTFKVSDRFVVTLGGTFIEGPLDRPFAMVGQFRGNDNVFVLLSHYF